MALIDISLVSETLKRLVDYYNWSLDDWGAAGRPTVSVKPPDLLKPDSLGIYLYHISEDSQYKNLPSPGQDFPPVRYVPMGLNLFYQLTAQCAVDDNKDTGTLKEQKMVGMAVKALHDYPVIDDTTTIIVPTEVPPEQIVFPSGLQGTENRFRLVLQPIAHNEATNYWAAGSNSPRLAAYYQVSVVLLEPEKTKSRAGRVLSYGTHIFVGGAPRIDSCKNTLSFKIPDEADPREVELRPAQAPPAETPLPDPVPIDHKILFIGTGFKVGSTNLMLKNKRWEDPQEVDSNLWQIAVSKDGLNAVIREKLSAGGTEVLPGIYGAVAKVVKQIVLPDGTGRNIEHLSNQCPFAISPRIDTIVIAGNIVTITGYKFEHPDILPDAIMVYYGNLKLEQDNVDPPALSKFTVINSSKIKIRLPNIDENSKPFIADKFYPVRIFVNGVESPPKWIQYP